MNRFLTLRGRLGPLLREERERFRDRRFWVVQAIVLALAGLHAFLEGLFHFQALPALYFVPEALFLLPVGYAALNFGRRGAVLTALWCAVLSIPNVFIWHRGVQALGTVFQLVVVIAVALFVGRRVEQEAEARRQAEAARRAHQISERRYRTLFETSGEPVLVFDRAGIVHQANRAATELLGRPLAALEGARLQDLLGPGTTQILTEAPGGAAREEVVIPAADGSLIYLEPVSTVLSGDHGEDLVQAVLRNVTQQRRRRQELYTYAGHIVHAQEEERRRMAQDLHDDLLQGLILLVRHLDTIDDHLEVAPAATTQVRAARVIADDLVDSVRDFARRLRPPALEDLGLVASLGRTLDESAARSGFRSELAVRGGQRRLPQEIELGLFRIVQEALRNAERHAQPTMVGVTITFTAHEVRVEVSDDGRGFNFRTVEHRLAELQHFGLLGMQERAALLGGQLTVDSPLGGGTIVAVTVPG